MFDVPRRFLGVVGVAGTRSGGFDGVPSTSSRRQDGVDGEVGLFDVVAGVAQLRLYGDPGVGGGDGVVGGFELSTLQATQGVRLAGGLVTVATAGRFVGLLAVGIVRVQRLYIEGYVGCGQRLLNIVEFLVADLLKHCEAAGEQINLRRVFYTFFKKIKLYAININFNKHKFSENTNFILSSLLII